MSTQLPSQYEGEQIILSSGRLILNGRSDSVFLSSNQYIHINANEGVYIDVGPEDTDNIANKFYINAPLIQLGNSKKGNLQAVVKADDLQEILQDIVEAIKTFNDLASTTVLIPPLYKSFSETLNIQLLLILEKLNNPGFYKSDVTKTI